MNKELWEFLEHRQNPCTFNIQIPDNISYPNWKVNNDSFQLFISLSIIELQEIWGLCHRYVYVFF